ncbi:amino acid permease [Nostoc sp.]|uniref:amino acid permease n=1 Tax=Nostoc sp. TaxID=1180 RepID=UPI002FFA9B46
MVPIKTVLQDSEQVNRLFSHLEFDGKKLNHQPGSVLGSTALIAGTTVGAGILALPSVTMPSGIVPSTSGLIAVWLYALVSGLLVADVTLNTMRTEGRASIGFLGIVEKILGKLGARMAGGAYLFMHYALLVAYITEGGEILAYAAAKIGGVHISTWMGTTTFTFLFGGIMYLGREKFIEKLNSAFVGIVIVSFLGLLFLASRHIQSTQLLFQNWSALGSAISVMSVALFFQNVVPLVVTQLEGDARKIRQSIFMGSVIPLIMFLAWNAVILGSVTPDMLHGTADGKTVIDPLQILRAGGAGEWLGVLVSIFAEFAIATSFIGFVYGLLDVFKDIFSTAQSKLSSRLPLYSLVLFPPMTLGTLNPSIFFTALDYTGTFSISVLGGIIPALMSWKQRQEQENSDSTNQPLVPGGKVTLIVMIGVALAMMGRQILSIY